MGMFRRIYEARQKARIRKEEEHKIISLVSQIHKEAKELSKDDRVSMLLDDIDNAFSFNVSHISICCRSKGNRYDNAVFIYYVHSDPEHQSNPAPIPPTRLNFSDYDLYFSAEDACALLYLIFRTYAGERPRYCEPISDAHPETTYNSLEGAVRSSRSSRGEACTIWSGIRTICFHDPFIKTGEV
ncbi:MAG: hypothetical protein IJS94_06450 [Clostridia bacterium]|nr:hypothetical protein [Clostridia bacterium]